MKRLRFSNRILFAASQRNPVHAFTLVELLVAIAVFAVVLVLVLSLTSGTMIVVHASQGRIEAEGELRGAMDRMLADFSAAVIHPDLLPYLVKKDGNDEIYLYVRADGYDGDRGISVIGYRVRNHGLERGAQGTGWASGQIAFSGSLANSPLLTEGNDQFDAAGKHVLRFETEFILSDGSVSPDPPSSDWKEIDAVVVSLVAIDKRSWAKAQGSFKELAGLFPDATAGQRVFADWTEMLNDPAFMEGDDDFPASVRSGVRIRQRVLPVRK